jgi:hypothetical protein
VLECDLGQSGSDLCSQLRQTPELVLQSGLFYATIPAMLRVLLAPWRCCLVVAGFVFAFNSPVLSATVSVTPSADTFVRAAAPTFNYGGAGAIAVAGASATNSAGQTNGAFDSFIRFPCSNLVAIVDAAIGSHSWVVTRASLHLTEMAAPPLATFNRGVGAFEVRWVADDNWIEGTGVPVQPTTDGLKYQDLPFILNPATDVSLGHFTNSGLDGPLSFELVPATAFANDARGGGDVTLCLTAVSPRIGFTIDSRSFTISNNWPALEITALAAPNGVLRSIAKTSPSQVTITFDAASNWATTLQAASDPNFVSSSNLLIVPPQSPASHTNVQETIAAQSRFYRLLFTQ